MATNGGETVTAQKVTPPEDKPEAAQQDTGSQKAVQKPSDDAMTLTAQKVDPQQVKQEEEAQAKAWAPKEKKKIPLVLQPLEFVISSVVDAICFWKKD